MNLRMPGKSYDGPFEPLGERETALREELRRDVATLALEIGERNVPEYEALCAAADFVGTSLADSGLHVRRYGYPVDSRACDNLEAEIPGGDRADEIVVVGAHYDTVPGCPGANDNATGVAAMLALARAFRGRDLRRTLRFVAFVNEEPPYYHGHLMGSAVYARLCRERGDNIAAMLSLETIGCYHDESGSQRYPFPFSLFYPSQANFIGFVGNLASRALVRRVMASFREHVRFPSEGGAFPEFIPGIAWSDQWSFWREGYPAVMVTDTAPFRYDAYHTPWDTPEKIAYDPFARVVAGLDHVIADLANPAAPEDRGT